MASRKTWSRAARLRQREQKEADKTRITALRAEGKTGKEIAVLLGCSPAKVSKLLNEALSESPSLRDEDVKQIRHRLDAIIKEVKQKAELGWKRSLTNKKRTKSTQIKVPERNEDCGPDGIETKIEESSEGQAGDPAFLTVILNCVEKWAKLWGANAPEKHEISGDTSTDNTIRFDFGNAPEGILRVLAAAEIPCGDGAGRPPAVGEAIPNGLYDAHESQLQALVAPSPLGESPGCDDTRGIESADGLYAATTRQKRTSEPEIPSLFTGLEP